MSVLPFFHIYSTYLSIFHQFVLYSSTLVAIFIKKRPHTNLCAPCHEVNGHDVYLAINRNDFSVSNEAILTVSYQLYIFLNFEEKRPLRRILWYFYTV